MKHIILPDPHPGKVRDEIKVNRLLPTPGHKKWLEIERSNEDFKKEKLRKFLDKRAAQMDRTPTPAEKLTRKLLKQLGFSFRTQVVMLGYIADFLLPGKTILEVDGDHHLSGYQRGHDYVRNNAFAKKGFQTLRISNSVVTGKDGLAHLDRLLAEVPKRFRLKKH